MYIASHGRYAEDGTLQGLLEVLQIPYVGSKVFASALGMDKHMQKKILHNNGIRVPRGFTLTPYEITTMSTQQGFLEQKLLEATINFPCVVKPHKEGSSFGVTVAHTIQELQQALRYACTIYPEKQQAVLVEEKIEGMEFSCIMITDYITNTFKALPITEVIHESDKSFYDYEQKYMPGRAIKFTPARCSVENMQKIQETCIRATYILGITNISRIDGFLCTNGDVVLIDPNTLSAMTPVSFIFTQAAQLNISHTQLINHLIETELQRCGMLSDIVEREQEESEAMNYKKIRVGVLLGGRSNEKEISLESGRNVFYKLSPQKYEAIPLFLNSALELYHISQKLLVLNSTREIELKLEQAMKVRWTDLPNLIDFAFIGLHGGEGESGAVQGALELLGVPYNGSGVLTSGLCMDKFKTTQFLKAQGFEVPQALLIAKTEWHSDAPAVLKKISDYFGMFPLIVKPHDDGCSVMVCKAANSFDISQALDAIFASNKDHALIEEFVRGMELTVGVIGNEQPRALPPSQAVAAHGILSIEEKFLPGAGENQTPAPLPENTLALVQKTMEHVFKALDAKGYVRIDCFYQSAAQSPTGAERIVVLEVNTLPGLTPATCIFHQAAEVGIKTMDFLDMIITFGFEWHKKSGVETKNTVQAHVVVQSILEGKEII